MRHCGSEVEEGELSVVVLIGKSDNQKGLQTWLLKVCAFCVGEVPILLDVG